jgi:hypothetical protein
MRTHLHGQEASGRSTIGLRGTLVVHPKGLGAGSDVSYFKTGHPLFFAIFIKIGIAFAAPVITLSRSFEFHGKSFER